MSKAIVVGRERKQEGPELGGDEIPGNLLTSIQSSFKTSDFSDMKIVTKDQEFPVHRLILSGQSGYFARLFKQDWKEVAEGSIQLMEDDPRAIEAMIHFMYGFNYDSSGSDHGRNSPMLFNVKVYQVADIYHIPRLKEQAKEKFTKAIETCWSMDDFPAAITSAYSSTTPGDRGLRDPLIQTSLEHLDVLLENEEFEDALKTTPEFAADLVQNHEFLSKSMRSKNVWLRCPSCPVRWSISSYMDNKPYRCPSPSCGYSCQNWASYRDSN